MRQLDDVSGSDETAAPDNALQGSKIYKFLEDLIIEHFGKMKLS